MKITGGSFGHKGSAYVAGRLFAVEGITKKDYRAADIQSVDAHVDKQRRFGAFGFIVGGLLFACIGFIVLGIIGGLIGFAIAAAGSFYTDKTNVVEVVFTDGQRLTAEATDRSIRKLMRFTQNQ